MDSATFARPPTSPSTAFLNPGVAPGNDATTSPADDVSAYLNGLVTDSGITGRESVSMG